MNDAQSTFSPVFQALFHCFGPSYLDFPLTLQSRLVFHTEFSIITASLHFSFSTSPPWDPACLLSKVRNLDQMMYYSSHMLFYHVKNLRHLHSLAVPTERKDSQVALLASFWWSDSRAEPPPASLWDRDSQGLHSESHLLPKAALKIHKYTSDTQTYIY